MPIALKTIKPQDCAATLVPAQPREPSPSQIARSLERLQAQFMRFADMSRIAISADERDSLERQAIAAYQSWRAAKNAMRGVRR